MRKLLIFPVVAALVACGAKKSDSSSSASATAGAANAQGSGKGAGPAAPPTNAAAPGRGFVDPPLGAPDAIEPPTRDIVPGMLIATAKEKGAKPDNVDYTMSFKPDVSLWLTKEYDLVSKLIVEYPAKDWEATKAKWGAPAIGTDIWLGANWLVKLSGCANGPCAVSFVRNPIAFLGKAATPPDALGNIKPGMTADEVKKACGLPLKFGSGLDNGFGWDLSASYDSATGELDEISMDLQYGSDADWLPRISKVWGEPTALGSSKVWTNTADGWMVEYASAGTLLRFYPMKPIAGLLAKAGPDSVLELAGQLIGKPKSAVEENARYDKKRSAFRTQRHELSMSGPSIDYSMDDKDKVEEVELQITTDNDADVEKVVKMVEGAWGKIESKKGPEEEEYKAISVGGYVVRVEQDSSSVRLRVRK